MLEFRYNNKLVLRWNYKRCFENVVLFGVLPIISAVLIMKAIPLLMIGVGIAGGHY